MKILKIFCKYQKKSGGIIGVPLFEFLTKHIPIVNSTLNIRIETFKLKEAKHWKHWQLGLGLKNKKNNVVPRSFWCSCPI